jgi:hypothetical protein
MPLRGTRRNTNNPKIDEAFVAADVVLQQLPIGQRCCIAQKHSPAKVRYGLAPRAGRHVLPFVMTAIGLCLTTTRRRRFDTLFLIRHRLALMKAGCVAE